MRKVIYCLMVMVLLGGLTVGLTTGCAAEPEEIVWIHNNPSPEHDVQQWAGTAKPWIEAVEARTGGKLRFEVYHGGSLLSWGDAISGIQAGTADSSAVAPVWRPTDFPAWKIVGILDPSADNLSPTYATMVTWILMEEFYDEYYGAQAAINTIPIFHEVTLANSMIMREPVPRVADLKGKKLRVYAGEYHAKVHEVQGAVPMNIPYAESYESLDKGIIDGMLTSLSSMVASKMHEVAKHHYSLGPLGLQPKLNAGFNFSANLDSWNRLPEKYKLIMLEEAKRVEMEFCKSLEEEIIGGLKAEMAAAGVQMGDFPPEDIAAWGELCAPLYAEIGQELDAQGLRGTQIVNRYLELVKLPLTEIEKLYEKAWDNRFERAKK